MFTLQSHIIYLCVAHRCQQTWTICLSMKTEPFGRHQNMETAKDGLISQREEHPEEEELALMEATL